MISTIKLVFTLTLITFLILPATAKPTDFEIIKERVVSELMETKIEASRVAAILERMNPDGSFKNINYADLSRTAGFPHRFHTSDLLYLAKAYKNKKSKYYKSRKLKERIIASLKYWVDHDFVGDNWHDSQITTPTNLGDFMLVIGDELPKDLVTKAQPIIRRANMNASGARPSGDRIVIAGILAKNMLFVGDKAGFDEVIKIIAGEIKFNTGKRGIQSDYSFHHREDRVNNTTSYGYGKYANEFGSWSYYVANTQYAFAKEKINQLVDYYLDGIYKQMVYGIYTDVSVKNRSITQEEGPFKPHSVTEIERLLISTDYRKKELEEIMKLRKGEAKPSQSFAKFFWQTEHFVFQRPNFYTTVRMFSTRNRNMEEPYNGPGKPTHHRADGTNYLMLKGDEYHNIWPVYDWQKISGTTIMQKPKLHGPENIQLDGLNDFVGAVTDGLYGAVAFDFISPHDQVKAKKAWFFFDEEYVCLGTDIKSQPSLPVATTINQALMRSDVTIMQNGQVKKLLPGNHELKDLKLVYHDKIGYILPAPATVHLSNQAEQGRWSDITDQKNISQAVVNKEVFKLWFDHGKSPNKASYAYIVVPAVSEQAFIETSRNNRQIEIIANTAALQAVKNNKSGITQMAFYQAGEAKVSDALKISLESQGMAMVKMQDNKVQELTLSDPSRKLKSVLVTLSGTHKAKGDSFTILPDAEQGSTSILVDLPEGDFAGKSVTVKFD
ncbi:MAG: polysaccharide lyase family 8 super-sandwich domain-containing protein [Adhaeribacter sp.]